jgi:mono/diheme cytochrome c family protein
MNKRKLLRRAGITAVCIVFLVLAAIIYITCFLPAVPLDKSITVEATPDRLARGRYLFETVAGCIDCHSYRDPKLFAMPVKEGSIGQGGEAFDRKLGFPGSYIAKNITPYHLGNWTDAELFRAITSGVSKDGHALFPIMPYHAFGHADKEDIYSIISYMRTLKPIEKDWPASEVDFPMNLIIHTIPGQPDLQPAPARENAKAYGGYLVNLAGCITCHSQAEKGKLIPGMQFAGGRQFPLPTGGTVVSANITPDMETGIGAWSREAFMQRFMSYADSNYKPTPVAPGAFNTFMPWTQFSKLAPEDISAIYDYLRSLKPVRNKVVKFLKDLPSKN